MAAVAGLRDAQTANMETVVKVIAGLRDASTANMEMVVAAVAGLHGVNTANMEVVLAAVAGIRSAVAGWGLGRRAVRVDVAGVADAIERLRVSHHLSGSWPEEAVGRRTRRVCGGGDAGGKLIVQPFPPIVTLFSRNHQDTRGILFPNNAPYFVTKLPVPHALPLPLPPVPPKHQVKYNTACTTNQRPPAPPSSPQHYLHPPTCTTLRQPPEAHGLRLRLLGLRTLCLTQTPAPQAAPQKIPLIQSCNVSLDSDCVFWDSV